MQARLWVCNVLRSWNFAGAYNFSWGRNEELQCSPVSETLAPRG
jgi:hypothetical protein